MKNCINHSGRPVFSKGLCKQCWQREYAKPIAHKPKKPKMMSDKLKTALGRYYRRVKQWKIENPLCKALLPGCTTYTTECHHMQGRIGELLLDESKWLPVCHDCHSWITENSKQAIELGLSHSRIKAA